MEEEMAYQGKSMTEKLVERAAFTLLGAVIVAVVRFATKKVEKKIDKWQEVRKVRTPSKDEIDRLYTVKDRKTRKSGIRIVTGVVNPVTQEDLAMAAENAGNC